MIGPWTTNNWRGGYFSAQLMPNSIDFDGRTVAESFPEGVADDCYAIYPDAGLPQIHFLVRERPGPSDKRVLALTRRAGAAPAGVGGSRRWHTSRPWFRPFAGSRPSCGMVGQARATPSQAARCDNLGPATSEYSCWRKAILAAQGAPTRRSR